MKSLGASDFSQVQDAVKLAGLISDQDFNIVRLKDDSSEIALLNYTDFFDAPFPELKERWLIDLDNGLTSYRTYKDSLNPPILHRKELLLPNDHPRQSEYSALTQAAEQIGLFDEPNRIGYRVQWKNLINERGYKTVGHQLTPIGNDESQSASEDRNFTAGLIARHRTAMVRYGFSAPIQSLARYGYLDGRFTLFDYGCGQGDDIRGLIENNIKATGWDPYFAPENPIKDADIVNLGFVINVIEDFDERVEALTRAYSLANQVLTVSTMLVNDGNAGTNSYNDGVITKRGTFQKYYTQSELKSFITDVLDEDPIPVGPGVYYVFRDKDAEQRFLSNRYRSRRNLLRETTGTSSERQASRRAAFLEEKYTKYREPLESLWNIWLTLGRKPVPAEVPMLSELIEGLGSLPKALRFILSRKNPDSIERAREERISDLLVYLALRQFEARRAYKHLEPALKRDIKVFFGSLKAAKEFASNLLFEIADTAAIAAACQQAYEGGLGFYIPDKSLQLHTSLVEQLPPILRVYIGCAVAIYGDYKSADLIKIHVHSGKLTLMRFDDFKDQALPRMVERIKLKLRELDLDHFDYKQGDSDPPFLYRKSIYINEEFPHYPEQAAFDEKLYSMQFLDLERYGPRPEQLKESLKQHRWRMDNFTLKRCREIPTLDDLCGQYLTYGQLIKCGKTQVETGLQNLPRNPDSYTAFFDLARQILDPVIDYFGMIELTYGFCSPDLEKHISKRVAPKLDQHAAHEKRRNGHYICKRLGAAVDFLVEDEDMKEVANWITDNTPFDRLYFYGERRPLHVSFGPDNSRKVVVMNLDKRGLLMPIQTTPPIR